MRKKDYKLIAEALRMAGEDEMEVYKGYGTTEPGATWWHVLNGLITRFKANDLRFNEASFRAAAVPDHPLETAFSVARLKASAARLKAESPEIGSREYDQGGEPIWEGGTYS
jgi:hypothetical protein